MGIEEMGFFHLGTKLAGTLYCPEGEGPHPVLVVLHGAQGGSREYAFYEHLIAELPDHGLAVFLFDRRGSGASEGDFMTASFDLLAGDGAAAVDHLRSRTDIDGHRIAVFGISQGGWIAPLVAAQRPEVVCLVIVSGSGVSPVAQMDYAAAYHLRASGFSNAEVAEALALRNVVNAYYRGKIQRPVAQDAIDRLKDEPWFEPAYLAEDATLPVDVSHEKWVLEMDYDPLPVWRCVHQPVLFVFADEDRWVPVPESMASYRAATVHLSDVSMVVVENTDHLMVDTRSGHISQKYVVLLREWLRERLVIGGA